MRISAWSGALLALFSIAACGRVDLSRRDAPSTATAAPASNRATATHERLVQRIQAARARVEQDLPAPVDRERSRCPDEVLPSTTGRELTLVLRTRDARAETRTPLPLRLVTALASDEFASIVPHFKGGAAALWDPPSAEPRTAKDAELAIEALDAVAGRPYLAELRIETYAEPNLFRRKDAPRSEWNPGLIAGRLVVYDLADRRALCQAPVLVRGDATGLPIRRRLREQTRGKLRDALNERAYATLEGALASISSRFVLPARSGGAAGTERWAAAPERIASTDRFRRE